MIKSAISVGGTVPSLQHWINPTYEGLISRFDKDVLAEEVNLPEEWMDDFPDYNYKYTHLSKLLDTKSTIDGSPIYKPNGYQTAEKFDATWLDYYQLFKDELSTFGTKKVAKKDDEPKKRKPGLARYMRVTEGKVLNSIHINCEPAVLASLNHYIRTQFRNPWEWMITFDSTFDPNKSYLNVPPKADDPFDEHPKQRGIYQGVDGDGDFTSLNNIRSLDFPANLFTSTGNTSVQLLASVVCMCHTLQKEGSAIIQLNVNPENCTFIVGLMYLLSCIFNKAEIVRLRKFYFHGSNFKGLAKTYLARLTKLLPYYRNIKGNIPALFVKDAIPSAMISALGMAFGRKYNSEEKIEIFELQPHHRIFTQ